MDRSQGAVTLSLKNGESIALNAPTVTEIAQLLKFTRQEYRQLIPIATAALHPEHSAVVWVRPSEISAIRLDGVPEFVDAIEKALKKD